MMSYEMSKNTRYNFCKFIHSFQPETKTLIRKLESNLIKLYRQNVFLLFNQTCLNERLLPNYTYVYMYIRVYICLSLSIYMYIYIQIYIYILAYIYILMSRHFANGLGDQVSIPGRIILKTQKMVLDDAALLSTLHYKLRIKGKV